MDFIVTGRGDAPPSSPRPLVVLRANNWDDYSFKTLFGVELHVDGEVIDLEGVKIMKRGQESGYTEIPNSFIELSDEYCSLGLEAEYYEKLMTLEPAVREDYLQSIRDAVADSSIARSFQHETAWGTSLLRFGQATNAFEVGPQILRGHPRREGVASFTFNRPESNLSIDFDFDGTAELPGRTNVIIGYNGVGKTSLLAGVANAISQVNHRVDPTAVRTELSGSDTTFGAVVTVSYSAFDDFALPKLPTPDNTTYGESRTEAFGYVYCGLRRIEPTKKRGDDTDNATDDPGESDDLEDRTELATDDAAAKPVRHRLKNVDEIDAEFLLALREACERDGDDCVAVSTALGVLEREPSFGRVGISRQSQAV